MEDPELNRNLGETRELHQRWSQFHDFFLMASKGNKVTPQAEMKFLELKTRIAMLHDGFMHALDHDQKTGQNVMSILAQCIMLRRIPLLSNADVQKIEFDWNEAYLLMTETLANLEEEKDRLEDISENAYKMSQMRERISASIHNFLVGPYFKSLIVFGVLGFVLAGVPMLGLYDYMQLKKDTEGIPVVDKVMEFFYPRVTEIVRAVNPNTRFIEFDDIPEGEVDPLEFPSNNLNLENYNIEYLSSVLPDLGIPVDAGFDEAKALMTENLLDFQKERRREGRSSSSREGFFYYLLFDTSDNAKRFVALRRNALSSAPPEVAERVNAGSVVFRKANFVAIVATEAESLRTTFPEEKWGFKAKHMNK